MFAVRARTERSALLRVCTRSVVRTNTLLLPRRSFHRDKTMQGCAHFEIPLLKPPCGVGEVCMAYIVRYGRSVCNKTSSLYEILVSIYNSVSVYRSRCPYELSLIFSTSRHKEKVGVISTKGNLCSPIWLRAKHALHKADGS